MSESKESKKDTKNANDKQRRALKEFQYNLTSFEKATKDLDQDLVGLIKQINMWEKDGKKDQTTNEKRGRYIRGKLEDLIIRGLDLNERSKKLKLKDLDRLEIALSSDTRTRVKEVLRKKRHAQDYINEMYIFHFINKIDAPKRFRDDFTKPLHLLSIKLSRERKLIDDKDLTLEGLHDIDSRMDENKKLLKEIQKILRGNSEKLRETKADEKNYATLLKNLINFSDVLAKDIGNLGEKIKEKNTSFKFAAERLTDFGLDIDQIKILCTCQPHKLDLKIEEIENEIKKTDGRIVKINIADVLILRKEKDKKNIKTIEKRIGDLIDEHNLKNAKQKLLILGFPEVLIPSYVLGKMDLKKHINNPIFKELNNSEKREVVRLVARIHEIARERNDGLFDKVFPVKLLKREAALQKPVARTVNLAPVTRAVNVESKSASVELKSIPTAISTRVENKVPEIKDQKSSNEQSNEELIGFLKKGGLKVDDILLFLTIMQKYNGRAPNTVQKMGLTGKNLSNTMVLEKILKFPDIKRTFEALYQRNQNFAINNLLIPMIAQEEIKNIYQELVNAGLSNQIILKLMNNENQLVVEANELVMGRGGARVKVNWSVDDIISRIYKLIDYDRRRDSNYVREVLLQTPPRVPQRPVLSKSGTLSSGSISSTVAGPNVSESKRDTAASKLNERLGKFYEQVKEYRAKVNSLTTKSNPPRIDVKEAKDFLGKIVPIGEQLKTDLGLNLTLNKGANQKNEHNFNIIISELKKIREAHITFLENHPSLMASETPLAKVSTVPSKENVAKLTKKFLNLSEPQTSSLTSSRTDSNKPILTEYKQQEQRPTTPTKSSSTAPKPLDTERKAEIEAVPNKPPTKTQ